VKVFTRELILFGVELEIRVFPVVRYERSIAGGATNVFVLRLNVLDALRRWSPGSCFVFQVGAVRSRCVYTVDGEVLAEGFGCGRFPFRSMVNRLFALS